MTSVAGREAEVLLGTLAEELSLQGAPLIELCVIGGAALGLLGLIERPTKDIDVVALGDSTAGQMRILPADPLPEVLSKAIGEVAIQMGVDPRWLNNGPARLMDWGLPPGFEQRLEMLSFGQSLRVFVASRLDHICFKTYAAADVAGRHLTDLLALRPTGDEMRFAFEWTVQQDPSRGFRLQLQGLADYMGVRDVLDAICE